MAQHEPSYQCIHFDPSKVCKGSNTVICGKRMMGKSHLLTNLVKSREGAKVVIFASRYVAPSYKKYFSPDCIFEKYDPGKLKSLIDEQEKNGGNRELVLAFDDVAACKEFGFLDNCRQKHLWSDRYIRDIIRYGSSLGITAFFSIQYIGQLDDMFKRNIDYLFVFRDSTDDLQLVYEFFGGMFDSFQEFKTVFDECTLEPYRSLVFDIQTSRRDPKQSIFWYKAPEELVKYVPPRIENKWRWENWKFW